MPSSVVAFIQYHDDTRILSIRYQSGDVYNYLDVPKEIYLAMKTASSKGLFLNKEIKGKFKFMKVE